MKKVVISGSTGFIGASLTRELLRRGVVVYGVDIDTAKHDEFVTNSNYISVIAEFNDYKKIAQLIEEPEVDVFYHFAWAGGFTTAIKDYNLQMQNAAYAGDAIMAAHQMGAKKFVYANTYNQYEILNFLSSETFEPRYTCIYATAKTAASLICRTLAYNLGIEYTAGLIPMPYGENNYSKQLINVVIDSLNKGIAPKLVEGNNTYDIVYIDDIVQAFIALGEKGKNMSEYYIGHRELKTFKEWMIQIRDVIAPNVELKFGEYIDKQQIDYSVVDLNKLYNDTGFECKADFRESMLRTAEWVKRNISF